MTEAARRDAERIMERVGELEEQWLESLRGLQDIPALLGEAREVMGVARRAERKEPWQLRLGRLTTRLAVMDHALETLLYELQGIQQVDPLFEPDMQEVRRRDGTS